MTGIFLKRKKTKKKGFSMMEAIIAVFVLAVGLVGGILLLNVGLNESIDSRDQTLAVLLAQEGTELVRNLRDNNWAAEKGTFETGFPGGQNSKCAIDFSKNSLSCGGGAQFRLFHDGKRYFSGNPGSASPTRFMRRVTVNYFPNPANPDYAEVKSEVVWKRNNFPNTCTSANRCVWSEVRLTNWGEDN